MKNTSVIIVLICFLSFSSKSQNSIDFSKINFRIKAKIDSVANKLLIDSSTSSLFYISINHYGNSAYGCIAIKAGNDDSISICTIAFSQQYDSVSFISLSNHPNVRKGLADFFDYPYYFLGGLFMGKEAGVIHDNIDYIFSKVRGEVQINRYYYASSFQKSKNNEGKALLDLLENLFF